MITTLDLLDLRQHILAAADELNLPLTCADVDRLARRITVTAARGPAKKPVLGDQPFSVLVGLAAGEEAEETAARMARSIDTVKTHRRRMYKALGVKNGAHAVAVAISLGVLRTPVMVAVRRAGGEGA